MSYRFGLSPADVVTDSRGNTINTTLSLYVLESDANARINAVASVPVTQGNWTYTSSTYRSLWARTASSSPWLVASTDALKASLDQGGVQVTDNGDGGVTLASSPTSYKLGLFSWVNSTFSKLADAVGLSTGAPAAPGTAYAGTANSASRSDHVHPLPPGRPTQVGFSSTSTVGMLQSGGSVGLSVNRANYIPIYVQRPDRAPLVCSSVGVNVTTAASAGGTIRFGMWRTLPDGLIDLTSKVFESGDIASTSTGMKTLAYTTAIPEGLYWIGVLAHGASCSITGGTPAIHAWVSTFSGYDIMYTDGVTGAFPTSGAPAGNGDGPIQVFFTVA